MVGSKVGYKEEIWSLPEEKTGFRSLDFEIMGANNDFKPKMDFESSLNFNSGALTFDPSNLSTLSLIRRKSSKYL